VIATTDAARAAAPVPAPPLQRPALSVRGLTKTFADVRAASGLDLDFYRGEVHAVLGENGAGKSTLVKMLYGFYQPDAGSMILDGKQIRFRSPADARRRGIGMVFQSFTLIPALTVLENVALVTESKGLRLNAAALSRRIRALSAAYGLEVNPSVRVGDLSIGEQQRVEILKALAGDPSILILDEPTSVLAPHEVESLLDIVRRLRADGFSVILITHKLGEVFACADRVSVLRRGLLAGAGMLDEHDQRSLLRLMLGDGAAEETDPETSGTARAAAVGFAFRRVSFRAPDGRITLREIDLEVGAGEMVGVAAVAGNGQSSLGEALLGTGSVIEGAVHLAGRDVTSLPVAARLLAGLTVVPEDPVRDGAVPEMTVRENLSISGGPGSPRRLLMRPADVIRRARAVAGRSPFPLPALTRQLGTLSGGNIQRVVLARELSGHCRYLLVYYPTRGLDLASTRAVRRRLLELKDGGCAVLLVSEDLDELRALCDRVVVLHEGRVRGEFRREDMDLLEIGRLMTGGHG
jgi:simple sugar transport system ATP-binding protein